MITQEQKTRTQPIVYEIIISGHLDAAWAEWFGNLTITPGAQGETTLSGPIADQAALFGLLKKLHNLGLELLLVRRIGDW